MALPFPVEVPRLTSIAAFTSMSTRRQHRRPRSPSAHGADGEVDPPASLVLLPGRPIAPADGGLPPARKKHRIGAGSLAALAPAPARRSSEPRSAAAGGAPAADAERSPGAPPLSLRHARRLLDPDADGAFRAELLSRGAVVARVSTADLPAARLLLGALHRTRPRRASADSEDVLDTSPRRSAERAPRGRRGPLSPGRTRSSSPPALVAGGLSSSEESEPDILPAAPPAVAEYISNAEFVRLLNLLRIAFDQASGLIPASARVAFFSDSADVVEPPLAPHAFPTASMMDPLGPACSAVFATATAAPRTGAHASVRAGFRAAFPTGTAADLPPDPRRLRDILENRLTAIVEYDPVATSGRLRAPRRNLLPSAEGVAALMTFSANLLAFLRTEPDALAREILRLERAASDLDDGARRLGLRFTPCAARRFARGATAQLASNVTCLRPDAGDPRDPTLAQPTLDVALARNLALATVEDCLHWTWRALSVPPAPWQPLPRVHAARHPSLREWEFRWAAVRDLAARSFP